MKTRTGGFTLIELMIVVAILAVIAAVALPSYFGSIRKSRRADAVAAMSQIQQAQERWRANQPQYAAVLMTASPFDCDTPAEQVTNSCLNIAAVAGAYYTYALSGASATAYTLTATAAAGSSQLKDTGCTSLVMTVAAGVAEQTPAACWSR